MRILKYIYSFLLLIPILMLGACEKLSDLLKADVYISLPINITIPVAQEGDMIYLDEWMVTVDLDNEITKVNNQLGVENIKNVNVYSAQLIIPADSRTEANNLMSISNPIVYFQSDIVREWKNIASWTGIPESAYIQPLNVNVSQEWYNYFDDNSRFNLKFQCQAAKDITAPITVKGEVKFLIKVSA